jgi:hypothetical protein
MFPKLQDREMLSIIGHMFYKSIGLNLRFPPIFVFCPPSTYVVLYLVRKGCGYKAHHLHLSHCSCKAFALFRRLVSFVVFLRIFCRQVGRL